LRRNRRTRRRRRPRPTNLRGSAFGLLAAIQSAGNLAASAIAGVLWTAISPTAAWLYLTAWMVVAVAAMLTIRPAAQATR